MAKKYTGSLTLDWYNKQKAILLTDNKLATDIPAPSLNWVNKDEALFYEINVAENKGISPYWVNQDDIRVKEARPFILQKTFKSILTDRPGSIPGTNQYLRVQDSKDDDPSIENILIRGDNMLSLNTLRKIFDIKPSTERVKCIYIDPPYNIDVALEDYEDNLARSEWLTSMRDRLVLLHKLLSDDGVLLVQISDKNVGFLNVLLNEIFGEQNFVNKITVRTKSPSGFQTVNLGVFETAEYIFMYAKDKKQFSYNPQFVECPYDDNYDMIILNPEADHSEWQITSLEQLIANEKGYKDTKELRKALGPAAVYDLKAEKALANSSQVFRLTAISDTGAGEETISLKYKSKEQAGSVLMLERTGYNNRYIMAGQEIAFYSKKVKTIDGKKVPTIALTNIWNDIAYEGIAKEGNVEFKKSKKPEKLIKRIFEMTSSEGDIVMDCFAGSGTSLAVAHKLKRKWIGVEIGEHADSKILPRLISVLDGSDQSGVTKAANWQGGGSFKYYHLGPSIITFNDKGEADFNWSLGKSFLEESFLSSYDYTPVADTSFLSADLFADKDTLPKIGVQQVGSKTRVAIVSLNAPDGPQPTISFDELRSLYAALKAKFAPQYINVFTNRGVELAYDSKPDDLEVFKIPHAIFAELEK